MASTTLTLPAASAASAAIPISAASPAAILALDLGTTTGWALLGADGVVTSGTASFKPSRYDGGGMRYLRFRAWLEQLRRYAGRIEAVHFEEVRRHVGVDAAHLYGGFLATLSAWCEHQTIPYQGVPVGTIKRFIAGKGNADKETVIASVRSHGFNPADDNEADAIAILLWAIETKGGVQ
jgi:Holliday junction resolvasome RuvABC endonuclease subunit